MFPHFIRPLSHVGFICAAACLLFTTVADGQSPTGTQTESFVETEPLLSISNAGGFSLANFDPTVGTLTDVTLSMKLAGKTITIFDTNDPSADWVDLSLGTPGSKKIDADALSAWGNSLGDVDLTYRRPPDKSVRQMGDAGLLLYCTPTNGAARYISINYTYDVSNNNINGGGGATPEPAAKYLAMIAGLAMTLMLVGRGLRRRPEVDV